VVVSVAGVIGLLPTIEAIKAGKDIALASKEVLVAAGELVMPMVRQHGVDLRPIDSEHSAVFQCLQGYTSDQIDELIITASGGPFRGWTREQMANVTASAALNHPTWQMGGKITIDSATLMNKALETIEARWLFDVPMDRIKAVVHPQSIVHSFVRFKDGSVLGQMGWPNMRLPILYALSYPDRLTNDLKPWNPIDSPTLTFEPIDEQVFPALGLARDAMQVGGTMPCAFNAANEVVANAFLAGGVGFLQITETVARTMERHESLPPTLENLLQADSDARRVAREVMATALR
jgi:1-deoxy-D-xylulose-5-phosphate reductoisomerase